MTCILGLFVMTSLIQTSVYTAVLLATEKKHSIKYNMKLQWHLILHWVQNQPNLCWVHLSEYQINTYSSPGIPLKLPRIHNSGLSSWSNMTWILGLFVMTSLIKTSVYKSVLLVTENNLSSSTIWNYSDIESFTRFITNPTCVDHIFMNPKLITIQLLGDRSKFPGFWNFTFKSYIK